MANLFSIKTKLNELKSANLPAEQHQFITSIIEGKPEKNNGWNNLDSIIKVINHDQIDHILKAIQEEIKKTSYISFRKPLFNFKYINELKNIASLLNAVQTKFSKINPEKFETFAKRFDTIFEKTSTQFKGTVMLPVVQGLDARLGNSSGECFGYVAEWAASLLKNKTAFGVNASQPPPFRPIKINSKLGKKYPDLNHLAFLTENISLYQLMQKNLSKLMQTITDKLQLTDNSIAINSLKSRQFYTSIQAVTDDLIAYADNDSSKIYNLNLTGYLSGHALGFGKIDNEYHFFDSNTGWYRFENSNDFKNWLPFYYKLIGYNKMFGEYQIEAYSKDLPIKNTEEKKSLASRITTIALVTVLSPILLIIIAAVLTNQFIIRGFRYALKFLTQEKDLPLENEPIAPSNSELKYHPQQTKKLEYLDLAINNKFIEPQPKALFETRLKEKALSSKKKTNSTKIESNPNLFNTSKLAYLDLATNNKGNKSKPGTFFDPLNKFKSTPTNDSNNSMSLTTSN